MENVFTYVAIFSIVLLLYSLFAKQLKKFPLSDPMMFVLIGIVLGPIVLNLFHVKINFENYELLVDYTLALVLFLGASQIDFKVLKGSTNLPTRLLLIGLPITIIAGVIAGYFIFEDYIWVELAILATILAPTDAALGEAVVTNPSVPAKVRQALNVESGLNDGISVPIFLLLVTIFNAKTGGDVSFNYGLGLFAKEIGFGLLTGIAVVFIGSKLIVYAEKNFGIADTWKQLINIALAFTCFSLASLIDGSGFIACFTGGFIYGYIAKKYKKDLSSRGESLNNTLTLIVWVIFGTFVVNMFLDKMTLEIFLYAMLSLTLVRIVPVLLCLTKTGCSLKEKLFIGWFGPRGLASIVFAIMLLDVNLPHKDTIILTIICTIFFSVILHGITANPMAASFKKK